MLKYYSLCYIQHISDICPNHYKMALAAQRKGGSHRGTTKCYRERTVSSCVYPFIIKDNLLQRLAVQLQLSGPRGRIGLQVHALILREVRRRTLYRGGTFNPWSIGRLCQQGGRMEGVIVRKAIKSVCCICHRKSLSCALSSYCDKYFLTYKWLRVGVILKCDTKNYDACSFLSSAMRNLQILVLFVILHNDDCF